MGKTEHREIERRLEHMKATAKVAGIKLTHQRLEILREIAASAEHPDVDTVFRAVRVRMPTVSQDTVYRTLWLLITWGWQRRLAHSGMAFASTRTSTRITTTSASSAGWFVTSRAPI